VGAGAGAAAPPKLAAAARKGSWLVPPRATWREHAPWLLQLGGVGVAVEAVVGMSAAATAAVAGGAAPTARTRQTSSARPVPHPATTVACRPGVLLVEFPPTPGYHGVCLYRTPPATSNTPHPSTWLKPTAFCRKRKASFRGMWGEGVQPVDGGEGQNRVMGGGGGLAMAQRPGGILQAGGGLVRGQRPSPRERRQGSLVFDTSRRRNQPSGSSQRAEGGGAPQPQTTRAGGGRQGDTGSHRAPDRQHRGRHGWLGRERGAARGGGAWPARGERLVAKTYSADCNGEGHNVRAARINAPPLLTALVQGGMGGGPRTADGQSSAAHSTRSPPGTRWPLCGPQAVIENRRTATPVAVAGMRGLEEGSRGAWGMKSHQEAASRHRCQCRSQGGGGGAAGVEGGTHSQREGAPRRPLKLRQAEGSQQQGTAGRGFPDRAGAGCSGAVGPRLETPNGGGSWAPIAYLMECAPDEPASALWHQPTTASTPPTAHTDPPLTPTSPTPTNPAAHPSPHRHRPLPPSPGDYDSRVSPSIMGQVRHGSPRQVIAGPRT